MWRCQDVDGNQEEEISLDWNSTATLHEMGMPAEPHRCYLLIREKDDGTPPKRLEAEGEGPGEQPTGQNTKKVRSSGGERERLGAVYVGEHIRICTAILFHALPAICFCQFLVNNHVRDVNW